MQKRTTKPARQKPAKPRPDFPLYAHAVGKWAKTIKGKSYFFGRWEDPEGALREYLDVKDDLYAGRTPGSKGGVTVRELCNDFMRAKRVKMDSGSLSPSTFLDYDSTCRLIMNEFGAGRAVAEVRPMDFEKLHAKLARKYALVSLSREITQVRSVFKFAFESDRIEKPVKFGPTFRVPNRVEKRKAKAKAEHANGKGIFEPAEISKLLAAADPPLKAMIMLGINCGFGNTDCANLPQSAVDLKKAMIDYPRGKTGIERRMPLWPETTKALREAIAVRPDTNDPADANLVFLTKFRQRWTRYAVQEVKSHGKTKLKSKCDDAIAKAFTKLLKDTELRRPGLSFYRLRHTFETIAGGSRDQVAVDHIMGHADPSMAAQYRHGIEDARLRAVVDHVRAWLFPPKEAKKNS